MATREFFLGGNTTQGFFSYYNYLIRGESAKKVFCIKGGPGTGKSSLMRKVANTMSLRGFDIELMHCSADPGSLDGVCVPRLGIAFVDGTSPHVIDPTYPGAVDEILNLGDFWSGNEIEKNKSHIVDSQQEISALYSLAYNYLAAAKSFYTNIYNIFSGAANPVGVSIELESLLGEFSEIPYAQAPGFRRKLFATAITSEGYVNYLDTLLTQKYVYTIKGDWGTGTDRLLDSFAEAAVMRGFYVETYYCPLAPETRVEHVIVPALSLALTTANKYHNAGEHDVLIDMNGYVDTNITDRQSDVIEYNSAMFDALLYKAISTLEQAKILHDRLETYYIPYMDFDRINLAYESILKRL